MEPVAKAAQRPDQTLGCKLDLCALVCDLLGELVRDGSNHLALLAVAEDVVDLRLSLLA